MDPESPIPAPPASPEEMPPEDAGSFSDQSEGAAIVATTGEVEKPDDIVSLDVEIVLDEQQEKDIVHYLETNLPLMQPSLKEDQRIREYLAMYELASRKRTFPYENAPSLASDDAHDHINAWLDKAETAFLQQRVTFTIDRSQCSISEEAIRRMESTWHNEFFLRSGFSEELRLILFEAGFLGVAVVGVRENFNVRPVREKLILNDLSKLDEHQTDLTKAEYDKAKMIMSNGGVFVAQRDSLKIENIGAKASRIDLTKFWYPRNAKHIKEWQVVSEQEFYTTSQLNEMVKQGLMNKKAVEDTIKSRKEARDSNIAQEDEKKRTVEDVKAHPLDVQWHGEMGRVREEGDSYEDEFAVYRATMLYHYPTKYDPQGAIRSWIQVLYCPGGSRILASYFCQDGMGYRLIKHRHLPYKVGGMGIAQQRFNANALDTDMKSLFLASVEQEIGAPLLLKENSGLFATNFRAYPGAVATTANPREDAAYVPTPDKSRWAVEGMKIVLGGAAGQDIGRSYSSGKKEEIQSEQQTLEDKARIHSVATDLNFVVNDAWKIYCRLSKLNTKTQKKLDWVCDSAPIDSKNYMLASEMDVNISWSSVLSVMNMTPDAALQSALQMYDFFHRQVPVSVNDPQLTINWLTFLANYFPLMDEANRKKLLPSMETFARYQQQLGSMGGESQQGTSTPLVNQSEKTPFHRPQGSGGGAPPAKKPAGREGF